MIRHSRPRRPGDLRALPPAPPAPPPVPAAPPAPAASSRPPWLPSDQDLGRLEPGLQPAIRDIILPAYEQLVLLADDTLQRSLGMTIVHLMWLEVLDQLNLKRQYAQVAILPELGGNCAREIDRHVRLIDTKVKLTRLLLRLRELRPAPPAHDPAPPAQQATQPTTNNGAHPASDIRNPQSKIAADRSPVPPPRTQPGPDPRVAVETSDFRPKHCAALAPQPAASP